VSKLFQEQTDRFLEALAPNYAVASIKAYRYELKRFARFVTEMKVGVEAVADVTEEVMMGFHIWLLTCSLSGSTVNLALRSLKLFLKWACGAGLSLWCGEGYELDYLERVSPEPPTIAVMKRLLELPNPRTPKGLRDLFALELLYGLGLRRAECCRLSLDDLDLSEETLFVVGKGNHQRLLPVGLRLKEVAQCYLFNARLALKPGLNETALLLDNKGCPLRVNQLRYIVKKHGDRLGLKLSTHHLRHACATHLVERGMELPQVQRLLGHKHISTTKCYAQISHAEMEREFSRCKVTTRGPGPIQLRYVKRYDARKESEIP
jgi:site-specific recombinase XerD